MDKRVERRVGHDDVAGDDTDAPRRKLQSSTVSVRAWRSRLDTATSTPPVPDAEKGQADDEVGVVVEELERDDPRVTDLDEERREAHEQDLGVVALRRRARAWAGPAPTRVAGRV